MKASMHSATGRALYSRSVLMWGLSAMLLSLPATAENVHEGGVKRLIPK